MMGNYKILQIASPVFKTLAWGGLVLGLISSVIILSGIDESGTPRWMGGITLIAGAVYFVVFFAGGELVKLLLDMNNRIK